MDITVLNRDFIKQGIIDDFSSLIWHRKYHDAGTFQLTCPASENNLKLIQNQHLLHKPGAEEAGLIDTYKITSKDGEEEIEASGYFLTGLLKRRIIQPQTTLYDTYTAIMHTLTNSHAGAGAGAKRKFSGLQMPEIPADESEKVRLQVTGKNLLVYLNALSLASDVGFRIKYMRTFMEFETYKGIDRSVSQNENARVVFSEEYENLTSSEYSYSELDKKTAAYVAGEGEGLARTIRLVDTGATGWDRFEEWVDARSSREEGMTDAQYLQLLQEDGLEVLAEAAENFSGSVKDSGASTYLQDWDLGDIVTIFNKKWDKKISVRITEIEEVTEDNENKIVIYVGSTDPTISDILKN